MDPMLIAGGMSLLGGLLGGGSSISPEQEKLLRLQKNASKDLLAYSRGVPGSDPQELAAMASMRGLMGQQQRGVMGGLFAGLGANGPVNSGAMLRDMGVQFGGQQSSAMSGLFNSFLQNRRNALLQSAQVAAGAVPAAQPNQQGTDFGALFGNLGQQYAYRQGMGQGAQLQQGTPGTVNVGAGGGFAPTSYGSYRFDPTMQRSPGAGMFRF